MFNRKRPTQLTPEEKRTLGFNADLRERNAQRYRAWQIDSRIGTKVIPESLGWLKAVGGGAEFRQLVLG